MYFNCNVCTQDESVSPVTVLSCHFHCLKCIIDRFKTSQFYMFLVFSLKLNKFKEKHQLSLSRQKHYCSDGNNPCKLMPVL